MIALIKDALAEPCTCWPNGIWADCCEMHDKTAGALSVNWFVSNYWLAKCVAASTYSANHVDMAEWKKVGIRRVVAPLMFIGTSTLGIPFRIHALLTGE